MYQLHGFCSRYKSLDICKSRWLQQQCAAGLPRSAQNGIHALDHCGLNSLTMLCMDAPRLKLEDCFGPGSSRAGMGDC
jgi:hypothetical protein